MLSKTCLIIFLFGFAVQINGQADEFCAESGNAPSLDSPFAHVPYVFGKIRISGLEPDAKFPNLSITLSGGPRPNEKLRIGKTGNYCFKLQSAGGTLVVEIDNIEVSRKTLPAALGQIREDFEIQALPANRSPAPGVVSAKFSRPVNPQTEGFYKQTSEAEKNKDLNRAVALLKQIVTLDPTDFVAWAKLGSIYQDKKSYTEALAAYKKSLEQKIDYTPAWINVGMIRIAQKEYEAAIAVLEQAAEFDSKSARVFQLLGETYLQTRQGTLGVEALNNALLLDPIGMAEIHLQLAHLYQLAGANHLATREYKAFLAKVPNHPERKTFESFIKKNPDREN